MKQQKQPKPSPPPHQQAIPPKSIPKPVDGEQKPVDELPTVEWGDRINSGKSIARGGKDSGFVPGAMPSK